MKIGVPKEIFCCENRVAMTPDSAQQLQQLGYQCAIQSRAGIAAGFDDSVYETAGVEIIKDASHLWKSADIVVKIHPPSEIEVSYLTANHTLLSFFWPNENHFLLDQINTNSKISFKQSFNTY